jgi:hypothetical protein
MAHVFTQQTLLGISYVASGGPPLEDSTAMSYTDIQFLATSLPLASQRNLLKHQMLPFLQE